MLLSGAWLARIALQADKPTCVGKANGIAGAPQALWKNDAAIKSLRKCMEHI